MTLYIAEADIAKFEHVQSVRVTDGARLVASRVVINAQTPVRWTIVLKDKQEMFIFDELQLFDDAAGRVQKQYATTELLDLVKQKGFVDWQRLPVAMGEGWADYPYPDATPYPVD